MPGLSSCHSWLSSTGTAAGTPSHSKAQQTVLLQGRGESCSSPAQLNSKDGSWTSPTPKLFRVALVALVHSSGLQHMSHQLMTSSRPRLSSAMQTPKGSAAKIWMGDEMGNKDRAEGLHTGSDPTDKCPEIPGQWGNGV